MLLKIVCIYYLIGLVLSVVTNIKNINEFMETGEYKVSDIIIGMLVLAIAAPVLFLYGAILGIVSDIKGGS